MNTGKLNLICPQGSTFSKSFQLEDANGDPFDITGWGAAMEARETYQSAEPLFSISTDNSMTVDANVIYATISYDTTELFAPGKYVYDIEIFSGDERYRILEGSFTVTPEVTR